MLIVLEDYYYKGLENLPTIYDKLKQLKLVADKINDEGKEVNLLLGNCCRIQSWSHFVSYEKLLCVLPPFKKDSH